VRPSDRHGRETAVDK
jgi:putative acetyltransferase